MAIIVVHAHARVTLTRRLYSNQRLALASQPIRTTGSIIFWVAATAWIGSEAVAGIIWY